jgi:hypothetical protein
VVAVAAMLLVADSGVSVAPVPAGRLTTWTWITLALIAIGVAATVILPRRVRPEIRLYARWFEGITPFLWGFVGLLLGASPLVMWIGFAVSVCLTAWTALTFERE